MFKIKNYFIFVIIALFFISPSNCPAQSVANPEKNKTVIKQNVSHPAKKEVKLSTPTLSLTPEEINLGVVSFDKPVEGTFTLKNAGIGIIDWSTEGPVGWSRTEKQKLSGSLTDNSASLHVTIRLLHKESSSQEAGSRKGPALVEMKLESAGGKIICPKEFSAGTHKEAINVSHTKGQKVILVTFIIAFTQKTPLINLTPLRLDMGSVLPEKIISKKILLTNSGRDMLMWSVAAQKHEKEDLPDDFQQGRYLSFVNEETRGTGFYALPAHLKDKVELTGRWTESNGYPLGAPGENIIKINFNGTGIILYLLNYVKEGNVAVFLDKKLIDTNDLFEELEENEGELLIADNLIDGPHVLTITGKDNLLIFEGFKILGIKTAYLPPDSIKIFPNSGATTRQTHYLTVSMKTGQMLPGVYQEDLVFRTNGGEAIVEVYAEVLSDNISKTVDIYRYYNGMDYLFTADPQAEALRLAQNNYVKEGIAFRLFKPETPGTVAFYRWYNPQRQSHFYHYSYNGGGKDLRGYVFEGSIGNIATSKLTNTRELYRWYNSRTGRYFYSTDMMGGKISKKFYRFDGIAGYVR
ncbi:MAG: hypothetical protein ABFD76_07655 [Smithella sp.]